ncbi:hypothetical protein ACQ4M3_39480 [Leptolyngbya sp. AN03gr2]|uniref:hypothetical protein n=1 Tax=unclassified Leptolyngbya TaxID=2650499 RepID=UPI003D3178C8
MSVKKTLRFPDEIADAVTKYAIDRKFSWQAAQLELITESLIAKNYVKPEDLPEPSEKRGGYREGVVSYHRKVKLSREFTEVLQAGIDPREAGFDVAEVADAMGVGEAAVLAMIAAQLGSSTGSSAEDSA